MRSSTQISDVEIRGAELLKYRLLLMAFAHYRPYAALVAKRCLLPPSLELKLSSMHVPADACIKYKSISGHHVCIPILPAVHRICFKE